MHAQALASRLHPLLLRSSAPLGCAAHIASITMSQRDSKVQFAESRPLVTEVMEGDE
jgi:hypothetical protein